MNRMTIKGGRLISPVNGWHGQIADIRIADGRIEAIGPDLEAQGQVVDAGGCIVTPGFIDIHTHCYPKAFLGMEPDVLGLERGATTILDAGSSGADNYEDFRANVIEKSKTKVFTLLNHSKEGLIRGKELNDLSKIDLDAVRTITARYSDNIVGLKARASASVVGEMGLEPIAIAARTAHELGLPLMIHVGNYPPALTDVLELVEKNDVITHAYHGKPGGILTPEGEIIPQALAARARGVQFDVGHGVASFSFRVFEKAKAKGFDCDLISTDIHVENYNGPVYSLVDVATKILNCGEALEDVIEKCTSAPARLFGLQGLGELAEGKVADLNLMTLEATEEQVQDSIGDTLRLKQKFVLHKTIYSRGVESEILEHADGNH